MKTLILMRHAKSAWDDPQQSDIDRPLSPRGRKAAPRMGTWLAGEGYRPDYVLCSEARRAKETLDLVKPSLPEGARIAFRHDLYMAEPRELLEAVSKSPDTAETVMLVGHNPGLGNLAGSLVAQGEHKAVARLRTKFPTGAIAAVTFEIDHWDDIVAGSGTLAAFMRPRDSA
ncbi:MAG TPA: histidine phosphatase family protein [Candidatus Cybelea sp.]|nr:histidine phosphatase family protein [Candidatus Cybelea sp.]